MGQISSLAWEAAWGKILTLNKLQRRGISLANRCYLCTNMRSQWIIFFLIVAERECFETCLFPLYHLAHAKLSEGDAFGRRGASVGKKRKKVWRPRKKVWDLPLLSYFEQFVRLGMVLCSDIETQIFVSFFALVGEQHVYVEWSLTI